MTPDARPVNAGEHAHAPGAHVSGRANVSGNARLTAALGTVIFALLFVEGLTILRVEKFMWLHVFVGTLIIVFVAAKIGSTSYRFVRYYAGQRDYVRKGPPPLFLRVLGPFVTITTIAVLATGIGALLVRKAHWLGFAHKATFVAWFGAMTLHVLGHALETPALAFADWRRSHAEHVPGASARLALLLGAVLLGLSLALLSLRWAHHWSHLRGL